MQSSTTVHSDFLVVFSSPNRSSMPKPHNFMETLPVEVLVRICPHTVTFKRQEPRTMTDLLNDPEAQGFWSTFRCRSMRITFWSFIFMLQKARTLGGLRDREVQRIQNGVEPKTDNLLGTLSPSELLNIFRFTSREPTRDCWILSAQVDPFNIPDVFRLSHLYTLLPIVGRSLKLLGETTPRTISLSPRQACGARCPICSSQQN